MDVFDRASALEAKQNEMALTNHFAKQAKAVEQESAQECIECDSPIPEGRRHAVKGCQYCAACQTLVEQGKL
ncbi:TraR/DksA C4-type zinc finger protein [Vibrio parahaemolyticus]|uniref:TraR/DksA C4-type zinc finger protein n=1 Tax=Vibrio TaxID=662 RepID=UPI001AF957E5|nr:MULTISPECIES: TraR/DksA C4-type zinc finger protein [Vibrio]WQE78033.1 TraR/DksA C4-type zinc finger protein [Vibrio alfacsensis]CAE6928906.1 Prokaryotic dksA/traR C4-type zinc finger [Vibrio sp. B1REV9]